MVFSSALSTEIRNKKLTKDLATGVYTHLVIKPGKSRATPVCIPDGRSLVGHLLSNGFIDPEDAAIAVERVDRELAARKDEDVATAEITMEPREYIDDWVSKYPDCGVDLRGNLTGVNGPNLVPDLRVHVLEYNRKIKALFGDAAADFLIPVQHISDYLDPILRRIMYQKWEELAGNYKSPQNDPFSIDDRSVELIEELVRAWTPSENPYFEEDVLATHQFVWQVKRKLFGLSTERHICLFLNGTQGCGKSRAVGQLISVFDTSVQATIHAQTLTDTRYTAINANSLFLILEETAGLDRGFVDGIKAFITANTVDYRPLYSNQTNQYYNRSSLIGTSNNKLKDTLYDPSGMRRFYEIICPQEKSAKMNFKALNNFGLEGVRELWLDVDEKNPVAPVLRDPEKENRLVARQQSWVPRNSVDLSIELGELFSFDKLKGGSILKAPLETRKTLYSEYTFACKLLNTAPFAYERFLTEMVAAVEVRGVRPPE